MNAEQAKERIKEIDAQMEALSAEKSGLQTIVLETMTELRVGDLITWGRVRHKGRVLSMFEFCGGPAFRVQIVKKDGSDGIGTVRVQPYDNPKKA